MIALKPSRFLIVVAILIAGVAAPVVAAPIVFSVSGTDAAAITPTVNAFQAVLGNPNNGNTPGPLPSGRREINWDGGGTATSPVATPFAGFQNTRGALFTTPGSGFVQATPGGLDVFFGRSDGLYDAIFDAFSSARVFTPVNSTITDVTFSVPGTGGAVSAVVSGFGAVFSDVDLANVSSLQFFDFFGNSLGTFFVPAINGDNTFSFLGVQFGAGERIGRVRITSGNVALVRRALRSIRWSSTTSSSRSPRRFRSQRRWRCFSPALRASARRGAQAAVSLPRRSSKSEGGNSLLGGDLGRAGLRTVSL